MKTIRRLGVLGGTFDPIHYGHLRAGDAASAALSLDEIRVIPAHDPPHRADDPKAGAFHRFALVALAIQNRVGWRVSDAELTREGRSYTAHTLVALHAEGWQPAQIFFILGSDAFAEIATWYDFPAVLDYANFAVVARPGTELRKAAERTPALRGRVHTLLDHEPGIAAAGTGVFLIEATTPDISSTDIRRRLTADLSIDDLVPAPVAHYIRSQRLYDSRAALGDLHGETERSHR